MSFGGETLIKHFLWPDKDFIRNAESAFGDQDIKTTVALVELHKLRAGRYPATLRDLQFTGQWDEMALLRVRYVCDSQGSAYYVEESDPSLPTITMPTGFWRGTGYSEALKPSTP